MKYSMTPREKVLLVVLAAMMVFCGYYFMFLTPLQEKRAQCEENIAATEDAIVAAKMQVDRMRAMERELGKILAQAPENIRELPEYDNSKKLMQRLNMILSATENDTVTFSSIEAANAETENAKTENGIVRRYVELAYECIRYEDAKEILQQLHDCEYPCVLLDVSMNYWDGYNLNVRMVFFEYRKQR